MDGLPDELGPEWRILHPFEIQGVRFPTEDTPPNHRRQAENNTFMEQYEQYKHNMEILIIEDEVQVVVEVEEKEEVG